MGFWLGFEVFCEEKPGGAEGEGDAGEGAEDVWAAKGGVDADEGGVLVDGHVGEDGVAGVADVGEDIAREDGGLEDAESDDDDGGGKDGFEEEGAGCGAEFLGDENEHEDEDIAETDHEAGDETEVVLREKESGD